MASRARLMVAVRRAAAASMRRLLLSAIAVPVEEDLEVRRRGTGAGERTTPAKIGPCACRHPPRVHGMWECHLPGVPGPATY